MLPYYLLMELPGEDELSYLLLQPFTAEDVVFWYNDIVLNTDIFAETPSKWLFGGEPAEVTAVDETTVKFKFAVPQPGIVTRFAVDFAQPFQPKHFYEQFHIK